MPIWTVARKPSGFWRRRSSACAAGRSWSTSSASRVLRTDRTAISAPEKRPL